MLTIGHQWRFASNIAGTHRPNGMSCAGRPLSVLDGIFMAIKDDIDCFPHPTRGNAY